MKHTDYCYEVPLETALGWELYKKSLEWELSDRAEADAIKKGVTVDGVPINDSDCDYKVFVVGPGPAGNQAFRVKFE